MNVFHISTFTDGSGDKSQTSRGGTRVPTPFPLGPRVRVSHGTLHLPTPQGWIPFPKFADAADREPVQLDLFNSFVHRFGVV